jgi:membrane protein implicated in regulation of membrane protease activity
MTWADFYLICFLVGFLLSAASFLLGNFHLHIPGLGDGGHDFSHGGAGHADFGHADAGHADFGHADGDHVAHAHGAHFSFFNFGSLTAFLTWFGGAGFILTRYSSVWFGVAMLLAAGVGCLGSLIVFWFVGKVLMAHEKDLDQADYDMIGVLGRISSLIRAGGTGEIIYSQEGTRHTCGARSEDGSAIEKGTEVVVTRYERGIAYVRRWEELANEQTAGQATEKK